MPQIKVGGFAVRIKKGRKGLTDREKAAMSDLFSRKRGRLSHAEGCSIFFFHDERGNPIANQRCKGRKLKATNKSQCRARDAGATGKKAHMFIPCERVARRQARAARR